MEPIKYTLIAQHYQMSQGSVWYDAGPAVPQPGQSVSRVVTEIAGDRTEGNLLIVPIDKLEEIK
jgi:hypothetical protein